MASRMLVSPNWGLLAPRATRRPAPEQARHRLFLSQQKGVFVSVVDDSVVRAPFHRPRVMTPPSSRLRGAWPTYYGGPGSVVSTRAQCWFLCGQGRQWGSPRARGHGVLGIRADRYVRSPCMSEAKGKSKSKKQSRSLRAKGLYAVLWMFLRVFVFCEEERKVPAGRTESNERAIARLLDGERGGGGGMREEE